VFAAFVVFDDEAVDDAFDEVDDVDGDCDCLLDKLAVDDDDKDVADVDEFCTGIDLVARSGFLLSNWSKSDWSGIGGGGAVG